MQAFAEQLNSTIDLASGGDEKAALDAFSRLWVQYRDDPLAAQMLAEAMADCGFLEQSMPHVQAALHQHGETTGLCYVMGKIAAQMAMNDIAQKLLVRAIELDSLNFAAYIELAKCNIAENEFDAAIELLTSLQPHDPDNAEIDNILGNAVLAKTGNDLDALPHYQRAVAKNPESAVIVHNLAMSQGITPTAEQSYRRALDLDPANPKINLSFAIFLLHQGRLAEAWPHYEYRLFSSSGGFGQLRFDPSFPVWRGENLSDKALLVTAEQGIGDEILFSMVVTLLAERAGELYLTCDPRLVGLYQRSYPAARVYAYTDQHAYNSRIRRFPELIDDMASGDVAVDYMIPAASAFARIVQDNKALDNLRWPGLRADHSRQEEINAYIANYHQPGRLKVALSWSSGNLKAARHTYYPGLLALLDVIHEVDADFFVLQYHIPAADRATLADYPNVYFFENLNLQADIEANIAILEQMDVAIGPMIATQMFAAAAGCPVWLLSYDRPWNFFGRSGMPGYYPAGSRFFDRSTQVVKRDSYTAALKAGLESLSGNSDV